MAGASSSSSQVTSERRGVTAILRFANPPDGYIGNKAAAELLANLQALLADDAVRGVVITGGAAGRLHPPRRCGRHRPGGRCARQRAFAAV